MRIAGTNRPNTLIAHREVDMSAAKSIGMKVAIGAATEVMHNGVEVMNALLTLLRDMDKTLHRIEELLDEQVDRTIETREAVLDAVDSA